MKRVGFVLLMVAIALMLGGNALAQGCSNATFHGDYGFTVNARLTQQVPRYISRGYK
jgi:hypothetical protein